MSINFDPVSSGFVGSYKAVYLNNGLFNLFRSPVICTTFNDNSNLAAAGLNVMDGKGISEIASIGSFGQEFTLGNVPILIGDHSNYYDGRDFYFYSLNNLFPLITGTSTTDYTLPIMASCSLNITETEAYMNFDLKSDGIRSYGLGSDHDLYIDKAPDNILDFCSNTTRVAYNKDFIFAFGPFMAFIINGSFNITMEIREIYPVRQAYLDLFNEKPPLNNVDDNRQYKILVPGKIKITGNGTALIDTEGCVFNTQYTTNYDKSGYQYLSLQHAGLLDLFKQMIIPYGNQFELYIQNGNTIERFFRRPGNVGIGVNSSYITTNVLNAGVGEITVAFNCQLNAELDIF